MGQVCIDPNADGLVAAYDMLPVNGTVEDKSGNGNTGTVNGSVFEYTEIGGSMKFAGNGERIATTYTGTPAAFSVSGWFNAKSRGEGGFGRLFAKGNNDLEFFINNSDTILNLRYYDGAATQNRPIVDSYTQNQTYLFTITYDGTTIKVYRDTSVIDSVDDTIVLDTDALIIGNFNGLTRAFDGNISNFQFFERALTQSEITQLYNCGAQAVNWKSDYGVTESVAAETSGELSNSVARIISGSHKISTDTINGCTAKVVECVTAGVVAIPSAYFFGDDTQAAYGTFEWWAYNAGSSLTRIAFIGSDAVADVGLSPFDGYEYRFNIDSSVLLRRLDSGTGSNLCKTAAGTVPVSNWNKFKVTRSPDGEFTIYLNDELVDLTGGTGTNPVTDTAYTTSKYIVLDLDAGDKVGWAATNGDCSIIKHQGIV